MDLQNLEIQEVSIVPEPANQHANAKLVKSRKPKVAKASEIAKEAEDEKDEDQEMSKEEHECDCSDPDCDCKSEQKAEDDSSDAEKPSEEVKAEDAESEDLEEVKAEESDSSDDEDEEVELKKSLINLQKQKDDLAKELADIKNANLVKDKRELVKSLGAPASLVDSLTNMLVKDQTTEEVVVKLLQTITELQKTSRVYEEVGVEKNASNAVIMDKAAELVKSGKAKSYTQALHLLGV